MKHQFAKHIEKHLKKNKKPERRLLQGKIDAALYAKLKDILDKSGIDIREFLEAAAEAYVEDKAS